MNVELLGNPDFGHIRFHLDPRESVMVESGAMAAMDTSIQVESKMMGGVFPALGRKLLAGETLMMGQYTAGSGGGEVRISPPIPGHVIQQEISGKPLFLQPGSFLACTPGVKMSTVFGGMRAIFSGEGLFFLKIEGRGQLWLNAYGSIVERDLGSSGELVVDTGHVVGWEQGVDWTITGMGNLFSTFFSGEGLVLRFRGPGKVWLQTRSMGALSGWLSGYCRG
jgi:uncharacterized protein (TIGR00266 family)